MRRALLILALGCALAGCGGHTSIGVGTQTTVVVQIQKGWTKTYETVGFFTPNAGSPTICRGTLTETCTARVGLQVTSTETWSLTVGGITTTTVTTRVVDQAADGSITLVSTTTDSDPTRTVQSTNFTVPGTWGATTTASGTTTYTDASVDTDALSVSGATQIHTPVGAFDTWTTSYQHQIGGTTVLDLTEYFVPGIASFAYASGAVAFPGGVFDGTFTLRETNIPLP